MQDNSLGKGGSYQEDDMRDNEAFDQSMDMTEEEYQQQLFKREDMTISDLPDSEREKVSRLVEKLVSLGREQEELVADQAYERSRHSNEMEMSSQLLQQCHLQYAIEKEQLEEKITGLQGKQRSGLRLLQLYQVSLENFIKDNGALKDALVLRMAGNGNGNESGVSNNSTYSSGSETERERERELKEAISKLESHSSSQQVIIESMQAANTKLAAERQIATMELAAAASNVTALEGCLVECRRQLTAALIVQESASQQQCISTMEMVCEGMAKQLADMSARLEEKEREIMKKEREIVDLRFQTVSTPLHTHTYTHTQLNKASVDMSGSAPGVFRTAVVVKGSGTGTSIPDHFEGSGLEYGQYGQEERTVPSNSSYSPLRYEQHQRSKNIASGGHGSSSGGSGSGSGSVTVSLDKRYQDEQTARESEERKRQREREPIQYERETETEDSDSDNIRMNTLRHSTDSIESLPPPPAPSQYTPHNTHATGRIYFDNHLPTRAGSGDVRVGEREGKRDGDRERERDGTGREKKGEGNRERDRERVGERERERDASPSDRRTTITDGTRNSLTPVSGALSTTISSVTPVVKIKKKLDRGSAQDGALRASSAARDRDGEVARDRERETDRDRDRERETGRDRDRERETGRDRDRERDRDMDGSNRSSGNSVRDRDRETLSSSSSSSSPRRETRSNSNSNRDGNSAGISTGDRGGGGERGGERGEGGSRQGQVYSSYDKEREKDREKDREMDRRTGSSSSSPALRSQATHSTHTTDRQHSHPHTQHNTHSYSNSHGHSHSNHSTDKKPDSSLTPNGHRTYLPRPHTPHTHTISGPHSVTKRPTQSVGSGGFRGSRLGGAAPAPFSTPVPAPILRDRNSRDSREGREREKQKHNFEIYDPLKFKGKDKEREKDKDKGREKDKKDRDKDGDKDKGKGRQRTAFNGLMEDYDPQLFDLLEKIEVDSQEW